MKKTTLFKLVTGGATALLAMSAHAHMFTNFPTYDRGRLYEESKKAEWPYYVDGAFGPVRFNVQHACSHNEGDPVSTRQVIMVMPTGTTVKKVNAKLPAPWEYPNFDPPYQEVENASPDATGFD